jgi:hypothetical protein
VDEGSLISPNNLLLLHTSFPLVEPAKCQRHSIFSKLWMPDSTWYDFPDLDTPDGLIDKKFLAMMVVKEWGAGPV